MKLNMILKFFECKNSNIFIYRWYLKYNALIEMINHFSLYPFLAGIAVGLVILFVYKADPVYVLKYPHPSNVDGRVYRDKNDVCYRYTSKEVNCDSNEGTLKPYPVQ